MTITLGSKASKLVVLLEKDSDFYSELRRRDRTTGLSVDWDPGTVITLKIKTRNGSVTSWTTTLDADRAIFNEDVAVVNPVVAAGPMFAWLYFKLNDFDVLWAKGAISCD